MNDLPLDLNLGGCAIPCLSETVLPLPGLLPFICRPCFILSTQLAVLGRSLGELQVTFLVSSLLTVHFAFVVSV